MTLFDMKIHKISRHLQKIKQSGDKSQILY